MSWFTKYRPRAISELHLPEVKEQLQALFANGSLPQAILLTGPRGSGKTSSARILAAMLNDKQNELAVKAALLQKNATKKDKVEWHAPNLEDDIVVSIFTGNSMLVNELDAASNRGIDNVRQLREEVQTPPPFGLVRVIILDEVHMFSNDAFNALLKLLEEPPAHAVFVLATTERHKIPATVISRCYEIRYRSAQAQELEPVLKKVANQEDVKFEDEALAIIATQADGSFRDALKITEQLSKEFSPLTAEKVKLRLAFGLEQAIKKLLEQILAGDAVAVTQQFATWRSENLQFTLLSKQLLAYLHKQLLSSLEQNIPSSTWHFLLSEFAQVSAATETPIPLLPLELKAVDLALRAQRKKTGAGGTNSGSSAPKSGMGTVRKVSKTEESKSAASFSIAAEKDLVNEKVADISPQVTPMAVNIPEVVPDTSQSRQLGDANLLLANWQGFLAQVGGKNMAIELLLRSAKPLQAIGAKLVIMVSFPFHQEQLMSHRFLNLLQQAADGIAGGVVEFEVVLQQNNAQDVEHANVLPVIDNGLETLAKEVLM